MQRLRQCPVWKAAHNTCDPELGGLGCWGTLALQPAGPGPLPACQPAREVNVPSTRVPAGGALSPGGGCKHRLLVTLFSSAAALPEERTITAQQQHYQALMCQTRLREQRGAGWSSGQRDKGHVFEASDRLRSG